MNKLIKQISKYVASDTVKTIAKVDGRKAVRNAYKIEASDLIAQCLKQVSSK